MGESRKYEVKQKKQIVEGNSIISFTYDFIYIKFKNIQVSILERIHIVEKTASCLPNI